MTNENLELNTANGISNAYVALPEAETDKAVILIQEWWGVNDHMLDIADRYAAEGFVAIAPDLYRGRIADTPEEAGQMMHALDVGDGLDTIKTAVEQAREKYGIKSFAITGYCMGGTFALRAACLSEDFAAAAPFYGDVPEAETLQKLKTPVLFISGKKDGWINTDKVASLVAIADEHNLPVDSVAYDADHAFFNDTRPEVYDADAAADAWALVTAFFREKL
jgi:carboxymethylenebutenolidase